MCNVTRHEFGTTPTLSSFVVGPADISGTRLQGYLETTFPEIAAVFGEPAQGDIEGKITFRWIITFSDRTVATIYDYKVGPAWGGRRGLTPKAIRQGAFLEWNVGGNSKRAVWLVRRAIYGARGKSSRCSMR